MTGNGMINTLVAIFILFGTLMHVIGTFGLIRLPDLYNRTHAATKSATLGVICVLTGTMIFQVYEDGVLDARLILGILFVLITSPVSGHLIGRAAYRTRTPLWEGSVQDELKPALENSRPAEESKNRATIN